MPRATRAFRLGRLVPGTSSRLGHRDAGGARARSSETASGLGGCETWTKDRDAGAKTEGEERRKLESEESAPSLFSECRRALWETSIP